MDLMELDAIPFLGVDPGKRHVGLCLLMPGAEPELFEVQPDAKDVLTCLDQIHTGIRAFVGTRLQDKKAVVGMERQLPVGGQSSALMFACQLAAIKAVEPFVRPDGWVMPLPVQLQSYMKKQGVPIDTDSATVRHFKQQTGLQKRVSIHCVDAYYLTMAAQACMLGLWGYRPTTKDAPVIPWGLNHGQFS